MASLPSVIIIGSSGHAKVVIDCFEQAGQYHIAGLVDPFREVGEETLGHKVLGAEADLPQLLKEHPGASLFIAIGDNWVRHLVHQKVLGFVPAAAFATAVHPGAIVGKGVTIGQGTVVMPGAIINADSHVGDFAILNTRAGIDHDCRIGHFASVAPCATLGGSVTVGNYSAVSIGTTVLHKISIGEHTVVGAGALLHKDAPDHAIMVGNPARKIKSREVGDKYL